MASYGGILQADAYAGFKALYDADRVPSPITEAACWAHGRRNFFVLADIASKARGKKAIVISPLAFEAVKKIDAIFAAERAINGLSAEQRLAFRKERITPLVKDLEDWMRAERVKLSRHADVAKAMDYMLKRWTAFTCFLDDGRICISNNAAERALRGIALGRKAWLFAGSERGGDRAAIAYTLIQTALCRARHSAVYAARRTMPNGSGMARRCHAGVVDRVHGSPIPFGIVWSFRAPRGRRAGGRSAGSGFACRARTA
jgi:hypothetical protein